MIIKILEDEIQRQGTGDYLGFGFETSDKNYNNYYIGNFAENSNFKNIKPSQLGSELGKSNEAIYLSEFSDIVEIPLSVEPSQSFDILLNGDHFYIDLRTNTSLETFISINLDNQVICNTAPVKATMLNLAYFSYYEKGVFFFKLNNGIFIEKYNFTQFNSNLRLFYGYF